MPSPQTPVVFPPGRYIFGNLYKPNDKDYEGRPLVYKTGPNAGKPRVNFVLGVAIPKTPGQHWALSEWGKVIWAAGHTGVPNAGQMRDFAWKIADGDDPNPVIIAGKPPGKPLREREGHAGCWVVRFSNGFAPQIVNGLTGKFDVMPQPDAVNPGDYVQVRAMTGFNDSTGNPGVFINAGIVCFSGYGERIVTGVDPSSVGFQTGAVTGASAAPTGAYTQGPGSPPPPPGVAAPTTHTMLPGAGGVTYEAYRASGWSDEQLIAGGKMAAQAAPIPPAALSAPPPPPAVVAVQPNPAYAPPPAASAPPPPPGVAPARVMLPAAGATTYDQFKASGWTDAQLIQHQKMAP